MTESANDWSSKIDRLDLSLFDKIPSQTNAGDRRSLLAVQRATARCHKEYVYLEIGSHLGGSIQPHLVDDRCKKIYSIDARPSQQPDDRSPGYIAYYDNNSTERMLNLLSSIGYGDISKIKCFNQDASEINTSSILERPELILIDGEHTNSAVMSDFQFCSKLASQDGTILFHDFDFIYPAILEICNLLNKQRKRHLAIKLEDAVFAIFFNPEIVRSDSYLSLYRRKNKYFLRKLQMKTWFYKSIAEPCIAILKSVRCMFR